MAGEAGTRIPEQPPKYMRCGTDVPGWLNGTHPAIPGEQIDATVCFNQSGYSGGTKCDYPVTVTIRNCGEYFLYKLPQTPVCGLRYCATH